MSAVLIVSQAGRDLTSRIEAERARLFAQGVAALYVDLPLDRPESAHVSDALGELKLSYSGVFPNNQAAGDALRLQCLRDATTGCRYVAVASPHGAALLQYVTSGHGGVASPKSVAGAQSDGPPDDAVPLVTVR